MAETVRRAARIQEILDHAAALMAEEGVGGLSLSEVARRMGLRQSSLYKYFPSRHAVYDEIFRRASLAALEALREGAASAEAGLPALRAGIVASVRLAVERPVETQLVTWRPVPGFEPSASAFEPQQEFVATVRRLIEGAVDSGDLHPDAASDRGLALLSIVVSGLVGQQLANEPGIGFEAGRFTSLTDTAFEMFSRRFPPPRP